MLRNFKNSNSQTQNMSQKMTRNQLINYLENTLEANGILSLKQLAQTLENGSQLFSNVNACELYTEFLKEELANAVASLPCISSSTEIGNYLAGKYSGLDHEELHIICFDSANHIIADDCLASGSLNRCVADPRMVFRSVLFHNAAGFIVAHNHPSGRLLPSPSDIKITNEIAKSAKILKIPFLDHIIVGEGRYLSFAEENIL